MGAPEILSPEFSIGNPAMPEWASMVAEGNPRAIGIVNPELAFSLTEEEIVQQVLDAERESEEARQRDGREQKWWQWEDQYNLRFEAMDKQDWQADIIFPEVRHKILTLKSLLQAALVDPERFFAIIKETDLFPDEQVRFIEQWMYLAIRHAGVRTVLMEVLGEAFLFGTGWAKTSIQSMVQMRPGIRRQPVYSDPQQAMMAAMMGMQTMRPVVTAAPEINSRILCELRHVRAMFPDPLCHFNDPRRRYVVERFECDREELEEMVRLGIYDSLDGIGEGMRDMKGRRERWGEDLSVRRRKRDVLQEYTGNLYKDGELACRNWIVTVANEQRILRVGFNPIWSGKTRYACCTPIPRTEEPWGDSFVEADSIVEIEVTRLLNLMIDDTSYAVLGAFQIDETKSNEPEPITGIEPGRTYHGDGKFIDKLMFPSNANIAFPIINELKGIGQLSTMVNEFAAGMPSSRGRPTATEVTSKTQSSTGHIHNIARSIEEAFLEPWLDLIYELLLQFGGEITPELEQAAGKFGGAAALRDPVQRFELLDVPFRFQVRGISMLASRETLLSRIMQISQLGPQMGMFPQEPEKMWYTIVSSLGFAPEQLGYAPSPELYRMYMMSQQQQGGGGQMGGASGGNGALGVPAPEQPPSGTGAPPSPDTTIQQVRSEVTPAV